MFQDLRRTISCRSQYRAEARIGADSDNSWIRSSSSISGWLHLGEHEFLWELATLPTRGDILEIGSWCGKSTCILAGACLDRGDGSRVICVDTFQKDGNERQRGYYQRLPSGRRGTFDEFVSNADRLGFRSALVPVAVRSDVVGSLLSGVRLRLAFIDGQHDYLGVKNDIALSLPLMVTGGIIALHDVDARYPGIAAAADEAVAESDRMRFVGRAHCLAAYRVGDVG
jgi:predicted O-methyltransferase YrrM